MCFAKGSANSTLQSLLPRPPPGGASLGDAGAADARGAHLCEDLVQPLQRAVEVQLNPAGSAGHRLPPVFCSPTLDEAHPNRAHPGQLVHSFEALVYRLSQESCEFLVVKNLQVTSCA